MSKKWLILLLIVFLGGILRLTWLNKYPAGFTPDEAAFGYNAYSLLKTGHDEWGTPFWQLPFTNLRSFGDYKMPLYAFLTVPSVAIFGLAEFSTRLPNAILGMLAVIVIYFLCLKLKANDYRLATFACLLLAISPWALPLSRGAFEANLITLFLPLSIVLFLSGRFAICYLLFAISLYSYHSARLITPLVIIGLFIFFRPKLTHFVTRSLIIFLLLCLPVFYSLIFSNQRVADVSIFHPDDNWSAMATKRLSLINSGWQPILARMVSNKFTDTGTVFIRNYLSYFHFDFLFKTGPREATYGMLPGTSVLFWFQLPLILMFLFKLFKKPQPYSLFTVFCLLISVIPAALSKGPGLAANRAAFMVIPLTLMTTIGLNYLFMNSPLTPLFDKERGKSLPAGRQGVSSKMFISIILLFIVSFGFFIKKYIQQSPLTHSRSMGYGFSETADFLTQNYNNYSQIKISRSLSEPHIYLAFYQQIDPRIYQQAAASWKDFETKGFRFLDQYDGYTLGKYRFGDLNYQNDTVLYIGFSKDFPAGTRLINLSTFPDGKSGIVTPI